MPELPTGVVAFLFADLESAASGWDTQYQETTSRVDTMVATLAAASTAHDGAVFKIIGESAQAAFPNVSRALAAAIEAQRSLINRWPVEQLPRMAIHIGEAAPRDGDYLAPALNRLARLTAASHPGQILLTDAARAQLGEPPENVGCQDLGRHRLRDLLEAETVFQVSTRGLPDEFPRLRSLDGSPHNLPIQSTRLVGREAELARIHDELRSGDRLITLVGPGGVGKTRLSLQVGADELDSFPDGVWWAPLAAVTDPTLVLEAIAAAMPLRLPADVPLAEALPALLRSRRDLLILDNLEQIPDAAPVIGSLLSAASATVALVTSRLPLGLSSETVIQIDPLPLPHTRDSGSLASALTSPAVQLFVERAEAVRSGFELTPVNVRDVVSICDRLDGLPLAIELAAARIRVLAPAALLARLDRSLSLLTGGARDLPTRQQTLRGAIQWSYDLLTPAERTAFARLAVMAPGFTTQAAVHTFREFLSPEETAAALSDLQEQSLLRRRTGADATVRWEMLSTIHDFAREHLQDLPEAPALQLAHANAYLSIAEESEWFEVANQPELAATFEEDLDNYRSALRSFREQGVAGSRDLLRLTTILANFWWIRGHTAEGRQWLESAIASAGGDQSLDLGRALGAAGLLAEAQSDLAASRDLQERALTVFRSEGFASGVADSLTGLAVIARAEGDLNRARLLHQEAFDVWTALGDQQGAAGALLDIGVVSYLRGDYANAVPILKHSLEAFQSADDLPGEAYARQSLSVVAAMTGNLTEAIDGFRRSLRIWQETSNDYMEVTERMNLAEALLLHNELGEAEAILLSVLDELDEAVDPARRGTALGLLGRARLATGAVPEARALLIDGLRLAWRSRDTASSAAILDALAEVAIVRSDLSLARSLAGASNQLRATSGIERLPAYAARLVSVNTEPFPGSVDEPLSPEAIVEREIQRGVRR